jgi:hypothetical protein
VEHRSGAPGGCGHPRSPSTGCRSRGATRSGALRDRPSRNPPPPRSGGAGIPHHAGVLLLGAPRCRPAWSFTTLCLPEAIQRVLSTPGLFVGEVALVE